MHKKGKVDSAVNMVQPIFRLCSYKSVNEASLYTPRGSYAKPEPQRLVDSHNDILGVASEFFKEHETIYTEEKVLKVVNDKMVNNILQASQMIQPDSGLEDILMVIYSLIYTNSNDEVKYTVTKLDHLVESEKFKFNDFLIVREEE
jgi:hypothetical protein